MLNQQAIDSLYSATYMEDYLDCMENLPDDIQRNISRMRDLDIQYSDYMQELESAMEELLEELEPPPTHKRDEINYGLKKRRAQEALIRAQDIGDEKLQLAQNVQDNVENKARQLELDKKNLGELTKLRPREYGREMENQEIQPKEENHRSGNIKRARRARHEVFVPSILGPSTLEVTSYADPNNDGHSAASSSRSTHNYHAHTPSEKSTATTTIVSNTLMFETSKNTSSYSQPEESRPSGRGSERNTGKSSDRGESDGAGHGRGSERSSHSNSTTTPKKQTQKSQNTEKKVKKRKAKQTRNQDASPPDPIDPDEPTYCLCDQISYGEMIGCDNDLCPIEWFHFSCVNLTHKPKGKWYCPKCRGDKPNVMKSKALFLKELEKYNREKEEKA